MGRRPQMVRSVRGYLSRCAEAIGLDLAHQGAMIAGGQEKKSRECECLRSELGLWNERHRHASARQEGILLALKVLSPVGR